MVARLIEECGEVASEGGLWEDSGIKPAMAAFLQIAIYYSIEEVLDMSIRKSPGVMEKEGRLD